MGVKPDGPSSTTACRFSLSVPAVVRGDGYVIRSGASPWRRRGYFLTPNRATSWNSLPSTSVTTLRVTVSAGRFQSRYTVA